MAGEPAHPVGEVALVREAHFQRDLADTRGAACEQQSRALHPATHHVGVNRQAGGALEWEDAVILVAGAGATYRRLEPLLRVFGGPRFLGEQVAAAAIMDMATLSYAYGSIVGFVQGAHLAQMEGLRVDAYAALVSAMAPAFGAFLAHEGGVIQSGDFAVSQSPMRINVEATERIARVAREAGISTEFPSFVAELFRRADDAGYGGEELAALIKVIGSGGHPPRRPTSA